MFGNDRALAARLKEYHLKSEVHRARDVGLEDKRANSSVP